MKLDRIRRDAGLAVTDIEEADAGDRRGVPTQVGPAARRGMLEARDEAMAGAIHATPGSRMRREAAAVGQLDDHPARRRTEALDDEVDVRVLLELHLDEPRADAV